MIGIIEEHNLLSGYRFVILEYVSVGLLFGLLGTWYVTAHRLLDAAIWLGMSVNCVVILLLAHASLRGGAPDYGFLPLRDRRFRRAVAAQRPHIWARTLVLALVTFVPFLLAALVILESTLDAARGIPARQQVRRTEPVRTEDGAEAG